jgi:glycerophosphoryl diester phosphodiesterase
MLSKLPRPSIFAHRGASHYAPENTISAFNLALQHGAHAIELDVMLSADDHVVVIHDATVDRTTNGSGEVRKMNLVDLRNLDAGSYFDSQFRGEKIPTLEEVFVKFGGKVYINIELKNNPNLDDPLTRITAELVKKFGLQEGVLFSSFNPLALIRIKKFLTQCDTGLLVGTGLIERIKQKIFIYTIPNQALHSNVQITTSELVKNAHSHGRRVHVYTVDDGETMKKLMDMDVDGIFSNDPLFATKILESY